jgi:hypothetical protein
MWFTQLGFTALNVWRISPAHCSAAPGVLEFILAGDAR